MLSDLLLPGLYLATLAGLGLLGAHRLWLVARFRPWREVPEATEPDDALPVVTVQLPLFNERNVAARLIRAVGALDYPSERLEIQVLDDSEDETRAIVDAEVEALIRAGIRARVLRRPVRTGYKAGALALGLASARGECIAVFDADFVPRPDFLRRVVPAFADPRVGMVQTRWEHLNRDESLLTRAQATLLDGHFVIEHHVRHERGLFFNFNGTAGIWRRSAITGPGGWQHDTLTEDLDLSYRAQLAGWRFVYRPDVSAPAEVPGEIAAFKGQQRRWATGSVQVLRKLAPSIARARLPLRIKLEACAHLVGNAGYPLAALLALLLPLVSTDYARVAGIWHLTAFLACTLSVLSFYERSQRALGRPPLRRFVDVLAAMALGVGMSLGQTRAVVAGMRRRGGEFVRTPKRGDAPRTARYRSLAEAPGLELVFAAWLLLGFARAARLGLWGALPFLALFSLGFAWVGALSARDWLARRRRAARPARALPSTLTGEISPS